MPFRTHHSPSVYRVFGLPRVVLTTALVLSGCGGATQPVPLAVPGSGASSPVCQNLTGKFIGLPSSVEVDSGPVAAATPGTAATPVAGRWYVQHCASETAGRELSVRLEGPGWYFIDHDDGRFRLRQQVPLDLAITLVGTLRVEHSGGVVYVRFDPSRPPDVQVRAAADLAVHGDDSWNSLLVNMPLSPVQQRVAEQISRQAADSFRTELARGVTVTYDIWRDQSDLALGRVAVGQTLPHAFADDGKAWLVNERLALPPGATHVVGPFESGSSYQLDMRIERGRGVGYRAICSRDMPGQLAAVRQGYPERIAQDAVIATGSVLGEGYHAAEVARQSCDFHLVVFGSGPVTTLAGLRVCS